MKNRRKYSEHHEKAIFDSNEKKVTELRYAQRGRSLSLGSMDKNGMMHVRAGGIVNQATVIPLRALSNVKTMLY